MEKDRSLELIRKEVEAVSSSTRLDPDSCKQVHDFSGHNSAPYGEGGPSAAGPSSASPGK